ncbi:MAG: cobalamin-binding protein [Thermodesulfobacteriota bacterium]|nr:cobalamin-binding protein [Thermodesulfobacteriota bacterium]
MRDLIFKFILLSILSFTVLLSPAYGNPRLFTDEIGREVYLPSSPQKIVSLAPNITETLFALGLDREIAGVTIFCNYPEEAKKKPKVGGLINLSLEKIVFLEPDLIIATADGNRKETVNQLENIGLPVYVVNPGNIMEILGMISHIGMITGREREAEKLTENLKARIKNILRRKEGLSRPRVFMQVGMDAMISAGRNTFLHEIISMAGGDNIAGDSVIRYPRFGIEEIIIKKPDFIIVSSMKKGDSLKRVRETWERWDTIPAVKNNKIYIMDSDIITRPSPRIVYGLEEMFNIIHPEALQDSDAN